MSYTVGEILLRESSEALLDQFPCVDGFLVDNSVGH